MYCKYDVFSVVLDSDHSEAVRVDLGAQLLGRVFDVGQRLEGRGPGGGVDNLHQGPDGLVNQCQCHHQA